MTSKPDQMRAAADRVLELAAEVEASGTVTLDAGTVEAKKVLLRNWIESVSGVVVTAAFGRVTLIHADGRQSTINSPDLAYKLS